MRLIVRTILLAACLAGSAALCRAAAPGSSAPQSGPADAAEEKAYRAAMNAPSENGARRQALERFLADFPKSRYREDARVQLSSLISDPGERIDAMRAFLTEFPESEYRQVIFPQMLDAMARKGGSPDALSAAIDEYIKGTADVPPGSLGQALGTAIEILLRYRLLDAKRDDLIRRAGPAADAMPAEPRAQFLALLGRILYRYKAYSEAAAITQRAVQETKPDPPADLYYLLGKIDDARGDADGALEAYLNAAARRGAREIKEALREAWQKKHGSIDGLHEELDARMLARPRQFDPGKYTRSGGEGSTVLVELFTGAECGPCVGADLTAGSIADYFDRDTVTILQYHIHAPGPDPLTNPDSLDRARYYGVQGTPTGLVGGSEKVFGGGSAAIVPKLFSSYQSKIDAIARRPAKVRFADLKLVSEGDEIRVSGRAEAADGQQSDTLRLRIALVEKTVHYTGGNGVHFHHYVVRKLLGPTEGAPFHAGRASFSESVNLQTLSSSLKRYLEQYEKEAAEMWPGFQFDEKPAGIDRKEIGVVVFVQDERTSEVLNSKFAD
jgi:tetratricopeptide (TPR) repeat protein